MKPAPFDYHPVRTVDEALEVLGEYGDDARILAGGQSLVPMMNMRLVRPSVIVDINPVRELAYIREGADGTVAVGALTRQHEAEHSDVVARHLPLMREALRHVGHEQIRNRGTVGGSLAHADPAAELPVVALALGAEMVISDAAGRRTVPAEDFFRGFFMTAIETGEMLTEIRFPSVPPDMRWSFLEVSRRQGDFALVSVAVLARLDPDGAWRDGRIVLGAVGPGPHRARSAERVVAGRRLDDETIGLAAEAAAEEIEPEGDLHAPASYRRKVARTLVERALRRIADHDGGAAVAG